MLFANIVEGDLIINALEQHFPERKFKYDMQFHKLYFHRKKNGTTFVKVYDGILDGYVMYMFR